MHRLMRRHERRSPRFAIRTGGKSSRRFVSSRKATRQPACCTVQLPLARSASGPWRLEVETESGERHVTEGPWRGGGEMHLALPSLPFGYHRLRLELSSGGEEWSNEQTLIVVPSRCVTPGDLVGDRKTFGLIANLYTIRSATNWGIGDFHDLASLAEWAGGFGADFVGVNPFHALLNRGGDVSPYSPVSRLFKNPIYIDVGRVPELEHAPDLRARLDSPELAAEIDALRESSDVRYEQVMAVKGLALSGAAPRVPRSRPTVGRRSRSRV